MCSCPRLRSLLISRVVVLAMLTVCAGAVASTASAAPASFKTGFSDGIWGSSPNPNVWFDRTVAAGAQLVLLAVPWGAIAPARPSGDPTNPANPAYDWGTLDRQVSDAVAHGLSVAFSIASAGGAAWADGPGRPANALPGTWRPDPAAFGAFAEAVARRYSGRFNPGSGLLPHVRYYQAWGEQNLSDHLMPQWIRSHGHWVAESPIIYRGLMNAFYAGVKSVDRSDLVITGGTAPFGDRPGGDRMQPALFVRSFLCLGGSVSKPRLGRCSDPPHFDILAHHPYSIAGPFFPALNPDDVSLPDLWKLERPLALALRTGRALPRGHKQIWVTEFSWDSKPPDPRAVPMPRWEHWMDGAFYELWKEGVDAIAWYLLVDQPCVPSCADSYQSGVYYSNGRPKPGLEAFRFPFVVERAARGRFVVWGITPRTGIVLVQERRGGRWRTVMRFRRRAHAIFTRTISLSARPLMRARVNGETSIAF
jgi:hypothetical protein